MIIDPDFPDHWQTKMLIGLLGGDQVAPMYVIRLWAHCQNRRKWIFDDLPTEALKALCCFPGNANKLESSLVTSDFVRRVGKKITIVKWDVYNKSLIASWENGKKGGRNPRDTHGIPSPSTLIYSEIDKNVVGAFASEEMCAKFNEWVSYRFKIGKQILDPLVAFCKEVQFYRTPTELMDAIDYSIAKEWENIIGTDKAKKPKTEKELPRL